MTKPGQEEEALLIRMVLPIAEEAGFPFSESDFRQYLKESTSQELDGAIRDWDPAAVSWAAAESATETDTIYTVLQQEL